VSANRSYVGKFNEHSDSEKGTTKIEGSFYEWGETPAEPGQGARSDLVELYEMIKLGASNYEILEANPEYMLKLTAIERARLTIKEEEYKRTFRKLTVTFITGPTETGKTRYVLEKYGYENVCHIVTYPYPMRWDQYDATRHYVILLDEYDSQIKIQTINGLLQGYPYNLNCRYSDKAACFTKCYIISNRDLRDMYPDIQRSQPDVWAAFTRRINCCIRFMPDGTRHEYDTQDYLSGAGKYVELPADVWTPFNEEKS